MLRNPGSGKFRKRARQSPQYGKFRKLVMKRDKYKCQMPGCKQRHKLHVHHIIRYADSGHGQLNPDNALTLCQYHHEQTTGYEHIYASLFMRIVQVNNERNK